MFVMLTPASPRAAPDDADHPGTIVVAHDEQVRREGQLDRMVVDHHDPLGACRAEVPEAAWPPPRSVTWLR